MSERAWDFNFWLVVVSGTVVLVSALVVIVLMNGKADERHGQTDTTSLSAILPCKDKDALHAAALDVLYGKIPSLNGTTAFYGTTQQEIDRARAIIAKYSVWVETIEDPCARDAYRGWLKYYSRGANEAQQELDTGRRRREHNEYLQRSAEKDRKAKEAAPRLPTPPAAPSRLRD